MLARVTASLSLQGFFQTPYWGVKAPLSRLVTPPNHRPPLGSHRPSLICTPILLHPKLKILEKAWITVIAAVNARDCAVPPHLIVKDIGVERYCALV